MKKTLNFSQLLSVGLLLFAIFFGAGNVIFPPVLGQSAGTNMWIAVLGFIVADVGLSLLAIIAVALIGQNFNDLTNKVNVKFSKIFTIVIYLAIGPLCAIPRTGIVSYETSLTSIISNDFQHQWLLRLTFTFIFFLITYIFALNPSKLLDSIGKFMTPILLFLIGLIVVKAIITPIGTVSEPTGVYITKPFFQGFLNGYLTLDALAGLILSGLVVSSIKQMGVSDTKSIAKNTIKSGILASILLVIVYFALGYIGASSSSLGLTNNGAALLSLISYKLLGQYGILVLGLVVTFACLTTSIGITSSFANYFSSISKKFSYKRIVLIVCIFSFVMSNLDLTTLLAINEPFLTLIYPIAIVLILVSLVNKFIDFDSTTYIFGMIFAFVINLINILEKFNLTFEPIINLVHKIPLYDLGIGWLIPSIIGCLIGYSLSRIMEFKKSASLEY